MADKNNRTVRRRETSRTAVVKKKSKKGIDKVTIIGFVVLAVILGGLFAGYMLIQADKAQKEDQTKQILAGAFPEGVVATVGDLKIETSMYAIKYFTNKSNQEQTQKLTEPTAIRDFWKKGTVENQGSMEWLKTTTLQEARNFILYQNFVEKAGYKLSPTDIKDFENTYNSGLENQFGKGTDYKKAINTIFHVSLEDYKKYQQTSYTLSKYQDEKLKELNLKVTPKQAQDYYTKNKKNYTNKHVVQHILFLTQDQTTGKDLSKAKIALAKKTADSVLKQVRAGGNFTELVTKYSEDPGKAQNNGIYDVTAESQLVQPFKDFALKQKTGATGIVKTTYGFHVMKELVNGTQSFDSAKSDILKAIAQTNLNDLLQKAFSTAPAAKMNDDVYAMIANVLAAAQ